MIKTKTDKTEKIGVLLLNLGTPDGTDYFSMRRYLKEFLCDKRVIETNPVVWWFVLNFIVLTFRPKKSGMLYDKIWDKKMNDSPLRVISNSQAKKLQQRLGKDVIVDIAMRYGNPSTKNKLEELKARGCSRIVLMPLYPQYSAPTTASANDKAFDVLKTMRWQPAVRTLPAYYNDPIYINALAQSVLEGIKNAGFDPDIVVTSYHGMPQSYYDAGDPYYEQCLETTRLLAKRLGWSKEKLVVAFQSRFGPDEWIKPYTDEVLAELPKKGARKIAILAPAFSVDCLETLEEIAIEGRDSFLENGGEEYIYIPCLNDSNAGMDVIEAITRKELKGWL
ncbi:MAG: ferrochelatase [Devosiaceae bacterium]|nr:ferrochelatase [Devosiaceae bacterium]